MVKPLLYAHKVIGSDPDHNVWFTDTLFPGTSGDHGMRVHALSDALSRQLASLLTETKYT